MSQDTIQEPGFHASYAVLILITILGCISLFKPKDNYMALYLAQFNGDCNRFCLARIQYWTVRYVFHYAKPLVATALFLLTILFIIAISVLRVEFKFLQLFRDLQTWPKDLCVNDSSIRTDIKYVVHSAELWSNQVTWLLTAYFFQKLFGATLLLNGGINALIAAVIFDPWLFALAIWGLILEAQTETIISQKSFIQCYNHVQGQHEMFGHVEHLMHGLTYVNVLCSVMVVLSLSISLLLEWFFTSIRETQFCFDAKYWKNEKQKKYIKQKSKSAAYDNDDDDEHDDDYYDDAQNNEITNLNTNKNKTSTAAVKSNLESGIELGVVIQTNTQNEADAEAEAETETETKTDENYDTNNDNTTTAAQKKDPFSEVKPKGQGSEKRASMSARLSRVVTNTLIEIRVLQEADDEEDEDSADENMDEDDKAYDDANTTEENK